MRATQGMAIMVLASSVLCWRMTSGAERAVSSMLVVLLSGTDAASITDAMGRPVPNSSGGPYGVTDDTGRRKNYILGVNRPKDGRYLVQCVGRGAKIEFGAGAMGALGCGNGKEFYAASDSTYEWSIDWRGAKGDTACSVTISPTAKVRPSH